MTPEKQTEYASTLATFYSYISLSHSMAERESLSDDSEFDFPMVKTFVTKIEQQTQRLTQRYTDVRRALGFESMPQVMKMPGLTPCE